MRPAEVLRRASDYLDRHGVESPSATAEALMMAILGTDRTGLYTRTSGLDMREARTFGRALCQRCTGTPLQHLTGEQTFRRISLEVRPGVFVPRPETEVLVGLALGEVVGLAAPLVIDVGTGTGALALSVKDERPDASVFATDLSAEAVELARSNGARLGLDITVSEGDLFEPLPAELLGRADMVMSNPPYIDPGVLDDLPAEVRADPELALVGGVDLIDRLATDAARWLRSAGVLAIEIGEDQGAEIIRRLEGRFRELRVEPDLTGRDRVILGRRA
ncbi:MAG: peptide chain release factor N(5)-glutamine methyltransferase [Actinomycetota bacterium]